MQENTKSFLTPAVLILKTQSISLIAFNFNHEAIKEDEKISR